MKILYAKTLLFLVLVIGAQCVFHFGFVNSTKTPKILAISKKKHEIDQHLKNEKNSFHFGDSALVTYHDKYKIGGPSITRKVQGLTPNLSWARVDHAAFHAGLYLDFYQYLGRVSPETKLVLIPINLATFSLIWDKRPEYQFTHQRRYIQMAGTPLEPLARGLLVFNAFDDETIDQNEFESLSYKNLHDRTVPLGEFLHQPTGKEEYNLRYLNTVEIHHRFMKDFVEIAKLDKEDQKVIFYLNPINFERCQEMTNRDCKKNIKRNAKTIRETLSHHQATVLDLSSVLDDSYFVASKFPTEHLNDKGTTRVASEIANIIESKFKKDAQLARN